MRFIERLRCRRRSRMVGRMAKAKAKPVAKGAETDKPHDGLVKYAFSRREHAVGLLKSMLDPAMVAVVDFQTVKLRKDSFVDPDLRQRYADLVISARVAGRRVFFYVLVEHLRDAERLVIFRFGRYMFRIWDTLLREEPGLAKVPAIVPVLLSNSATGWTAATKFEDVVDVPEEAQAAFWPHVPRFEMRHVDLHPVQARGIVEGMLTAFGKLVLWALSVAGDDERFLAEIERMQGAIDEALLAPDAHDALCALLRYLSITHQRLGAKRIGNLLKTVAAREQEKVIMDVLDELRQEGREEGERIGERKGREEGRVEGRVEGRAEQLLKLLTARFGRVPAEAKAQVLVGGRRRSTGGRSGC